MKAILIVVMIMALLGCANQTREIVKFSHQNYLANRKLATEALVQCSATVGFIDGFGLLNQIKFPIRTSGELRAVINNPVAGLALLDLREICENKAMKEDGSKYWNNQDYFAFYTLGTEVRMGVTGAIDLAKIIFPEFMGRYLAFFP